MLIQGINNNLSQISKLLLDNKIGVIPTDTIYGISCVAKSKESVERIYSVKNRGLDKPFIILINDISQINNFGVSLTKEQSRVLNKIWPERLSVVLDCSEFPESTKYLHRGGKTLSFRIPKKQSLFDLIKLTGPLVSTSANISQAETFSTLHDIHETFRNKIDFYVDEGASSFNATTVARMVGNYFEIIRQGDYIVDPVMLK